MVMLSQAMGVMHRAWSKKDMSATPLQKAGQMCVHYLVVTVSENLQCKNSATMVMLLQATGVMHRAWSNQDTRATPLKQAGQMCVRYLVVTVSEKQGWERHAMMGIPPQEMDATRLAKKSQAMSATPLKQAGRTCVR
jgi:hypothetical protein